MFSLLDLKRITLPTFLHLGQPRQGFEPKARQGQTQDPAPLWCRGRWLSYFGPTFLHLGQPRQGFEPKAGARPNARPPLVPRPLVPLLRTGGGRRPDQRKSARVEAWLEAGCSRAQGRCEAGCKDPPPHPASSGAASSGVEAKGQRPRLENFMKFVVSKRLKEHMAVAGEFHEVRV